MTRTEVRTPSDDNHWARDRLLEAVAQLSPERRQLGVAAPQSMDLIAFYRERTAAGA